MTEKGRFLIRHFFSLTGINQRIKTGNDEKGTVPNPSLHFRSFFAVADVQNTGLEFQMK